MRLMRLVAAAILALTLAEAASAQPGAPVPPLPAPQASAPPQAQPQRQTVTRLVPTGIRRALSFVTPLNPDCSSPGSVEYRLTQPPEHGTAEMTQEEDYPRLLPN